MSTTKLAQTFPQFPLFKKASLADRDTYETFYRQFDPYSDFSFNNLWVWFNQSGNLAFSTFDANTLVIRLDDPFTHRWEYTVLGPGDCTRTFRRVLRWQKAMGMSQELVMVPQGVVQNISNPLANFYLCEDADNADYIYDVKALCEAPGPEYASYRRAISVFKRLYPNVECRDINLDTIEKRVELINYVHRWETVYRQNAQSEVEGAALNIYLRDNLPAACFGVFVDNELASFVIYHHAPQGKYGMLNHIKCNNAFKNISDFTMHTFAQKLDELGLQYENFEQDLGVTGLRQYKQSLRPVKLLKRFTITPLWA